MPRPAPILAIAALTAITVSAQIPPPTPPQPAVPPVPGQPTLPVPKPPVPQVPVPQAPTAAPAPAPTAAPIPGLPLPPGAEPTVPLQFLDTDVKDVLTLYERWTGRRLIYSTQLVGPIRIFVTGQVPQSEAVKIVEMSLAINGFSIVPSEDPKIWKVTGVGMNPKQVGIPFVDREEMLPSGEQMVMFLFKLKNADPTELAQTVQSGILAASQTGGSGVVALPRAQALLVTENTNIIRTLIKVVSAIDVEPAEVVNEFITLEHAQAEDIATALEKLFEKQQATTSATPGFPGQPRVQRTITPTPGIPVPGGTQAPEGNVSIEITGGASGTGPTEDNIVIGKVRITADKRTNRLHVVTRPVNIKLIRALIKEYDADVPLAPPAVRPLRFRPVEEVIDAVVGAIADPGEKAAGGATGTATTTPRPAGQTTTQTQTANRAFGNTQFGGTGTTADSSSALGESLSTAERDTQPVVQQVGKSTIIGDKRANSVIVIGPADVTKKVFALIDQLDVRQSQVMIHTIIGELRLNANDQFGLEYILRNGGLLPAAAPAAGTATSPSVGFDTSGNAVLNLNTLLNQSNIEKVLAAGGTGFSGYIAAGSAFAAALRTLEASNRFTVINRPTIFTSNNKRAVITAGEEVPVPTNINSQFGNTGTVGTVNSQSQIQFKPIELRLEVLPLINSENEVSLEIVQNVSERAGTTRIDNNDIPNISRRALKTYVTVPTNGTLILGGLIKESFDDTKSGIPRLNRIPIIGPLFGKSTRAKVRTELIVLMRPVVTVGPNEPMQLREKTLETFKIPTDLESAIMPRGIRETVKPEKKPATLRNSAPGLREEGGGTRRR